MLLCNEDHRNRDRVFSTQVHFIWAIFSDSFIMGPTLSLSLGGSDCRAVRRLIIWILVRLAMHCLSNEHSVMKPATQ